MTGKAHRLLTSGAVTVTVADGQHVTAMVRGDHGEYFVSWSDGDLRWMCSCPSMRARCSHVIAVELVSVRA